MKNLKFSLFLFLPLFIFSCVMSPDDMLNAYNDQLYEDIGGGMYQKGDVIINPALIPKEIYPIKEGDNFKLRVSQAYFEYDWTLTDKSSETEWKIGDLYILRIGPQDIKLQAGKDYSLTLVVKNLNGIFYKDTATIKVVKNNN